MQGIQYITNEKGQKTANSMTEYGITFTRSARKELDAFDANIVNRIFPKIEALAKEPRPVGCRKLRCLPVGFRNIRRARSNDVGGKRMSSNAIATVVHMLESLPESVQDQVAEHLREYLLDLQDEMEWDEQFNRTQDKLVTAARRAKREIAEGKAEPMDYDRL